HRRCAESSAVIRSFVRRDGTPPHELLRSRTSSGHMSAAIYAQFSSSRDAASASAARPCMYSKKAGDCPMNSPMAVRNWSAPIAAPDVFVGRMIEHRGSFRLMNGHGSGMIRLVVKSSPPNGGALRFGNTNPLVGSFNGFALPALSDQV